MKFSPFINTVLLVCIIVAIFAINQIDLLDLLSTCDFKKHYMENPLVFHLILLMMLWILYNIAHRMLCSSIKPIYENFTANDYEKYNIEKRHFELTTQINGVSYTLALLNSYNLRDQFIKCNNADIMPQPVLLSDTDNWENANSNFRIIPIYLPTGDATNTYALTCNIANNAQKIEEYIVSYSPFDTNIYDIGKLEYICTVKKDNVGAQLSSPINGLTIEPLENGTENKLYFTRGDNKYYLTHSVTGNYKSITLTQDTSKAIIFNITLTTF